MTTQPRHNEESGQIIVFAALALVVLVIFAMGMIRYMQMVALANFTQDTVKFAAEVAARPSGSNLTTGRLQIDEAEANAIIKAELSRALDQATNLNHPKHLIIQDNTTIEILQPDGTCQSFPDDGRCFSVPAIRVTMTVPFQFMGFNLNITRSGIATTGALPGTGDNDPTLPMPTPVILPTEFVTPIPNPVMNSTPTIMAAEPVVIVIVKTPTPNVIPTP